MQRNGSMALVLCIMFMFASLSGCFGEEEDDGLPSISNLEITPDQWQAGVWNRVSFKALEPMNVYIPHFMLDTSTQFIQNGTILSLEKNEVVELEILPSARLNVASMIIAGPDQKQFPLRHANESWSTWYVRTGGVGTSDMGWVQPTINQEGGMHPYLGFGNMSSSTRVAYVEVNLVRPIDSTLTVEQGQAHSEGWVDGREVYEWIAMITDETTDLTDPYDGAVGYLDRWIGNGNPAYEDAVAFFSGVMEGYGLDVEVHRFQAGTAWAVNVCGYKTGSVYPNEWLVFGAHFDIAPPVAYTPGPDIPGYGTRTGAYDNTAGTSMILETAESLSKINTRRTMVFCLWSSEEEGLWGSSSWTQDIAERDEIKVTNYVNLDMMGINWPGDWVLSCYIGPEVDPNIIDQAPMYELAEWIGAGQLGLETQIAKGWAAWSADGESAMWSNQYEDTVAIYESPTARSDHEPFQANLNTITMGWNGVVDGYPCYHRNCDRLSQMESYMETDHGTGEQNLVESFDVVAWWSTMVFLSLDQDPILNEL
jgi:hypothetical protein